VIDTPTFPASLKPIAQSQIDAYAVFEKSGADWTFFAPATSIQPGERTGQHRTATDKPVLDAAGNRSVSAEDYAVALLDEIETPKFKHGRMIAAYSLDSDHGSAGVGARPSPRPVAVMEQA
jgi:putative NADH-flavin reductase